MRRTSWMQLGVIAPLIWFLASVPAASGDTTVEPGETYYWGSPDGCQKGSVDDNCGFLAACDADFRCDTTGPSYFRVRLYATVHDGIGESVSAEGWAYRRFTVSGTGTYSIPAYISTHPGWIGTIAAGLGVGSKASIEADVILYDVTAGRTIDSQRFLDASSPSPVQVAFYDIPEGDQDVNITASVTRGHTYEIRLRAKAAAKSGIGALTEVVFGGNFGGYVELQRFDEAQGGAIALTLGQDPFEQILEMQDQLAALAEQYAELQAEFDGHTHVYLTGRGTGHNDVEAATTSPVVEEAAPPEIEESPGPGVDPEAPTVIPVETLRLETPVSRRSGSIAIRYKVGEIGSGEPVTVMVYDVTGREVRTLGNEFLQPGDYTIDWDRRDTFGREVPAGVYLLKLQSGDRAATKKLVLMR